MNIHIPCDPTSLLLGRDASAHVCHQTHRRILTAVLFIIEKQKQVCQSTIEQIIVYS